MKSLTRLQRFFDGYDVDLTIADIAVLSAILTVLFGVLYAILAFALAL